MSLLVTSVSAFLDTFQTASGKCSILLRWRAHPCILRDFNVGRSLGSG